MFCFDVSCVVHSIVGSKRAETPVIDDQSELAIVSRPFVCSDVNALIVGFVPGRGPGSAAVQPHSIFARQSE